MKTLRAHWLKRWVVNRQFFLEPPLLNAIQKVLPLQTSLSNYKTGLMFQFESTQAAIETEKSGKQ